MSNPLDKLSLEDLRRRTSAKWREYPPDVLPVWVAEMDVPLAEPITEAVVQALSLGDTGYPSAGAYGEAMAEFASKRWGWTLDASLTRIVPDVMNGIAEVLKLVTRPGDAVVVNPPVYPPFFFFVEHANRRIVEAPLSAQGRLDVATLEQAFAEARAGGGDAAYLLCSPHNPTGVVHTRDELEAVADLANAAGVRVIVDEIHAPLVMPGAQHIPYLTVQGGGSGFALLSASKAWNLAGLRAALAVAGPGAADDVARMPPEVRFGASHVGVIAHVAALQAGGEWLDGLLSGLDDNRHLLEKLLAEHLPAVRYRPPDATYLAWLDCRELGVGDDPAAVFFERGRVALSPGPTFGTGGAGHARLNLATSPDILAEAVRRMAASL